MNLKKIGIALSLILFLLPITKIYGENSNFDTKNKVISSDQIASVKEAIKEYTPDFIAKPAIATANRVDSFREEITIKLENKKEETKAELEKLEKIDLKEDENNIQKPLKQIEYFFLDSTSFIFNSKIIFYCILITILLFTLRWIWHRIF